MEAELIEVPESFLSTLTKFAEAASCRVEVEEGGEDGIPHIRHDILGTKDDGVWYCLSLVFFPEDGSVGIWTREMMDETQNADQVRRTYTFDPSTFERWLGGWLEDAVLEELTHP